jgi:hypothetical protein
VIGVYGYGECAGRVGLVGQYGLRQGLGWITAQNTGTGFIWEEQGGDLEIFGIVGEWVGLAVRVPVGAGVTGLAGLIPCCAHQGNDCI